MDFICFFLKNTNRGVNLNTSINRSDAFYTRSDINGIHPSCSIDINCTSIFVKFKRPLPASNWMHEKVKTGVENNFAFSFLKKKNRDRWVFRTFSINLNTKSIIWQQTELQCTMASYNFQCVNDILNKEKLILWSS